jgi:cytochrome P450
MVTQLIEEYDLPPVFYIDARPASPVVTMVIADPEVAREVCESGLPKHPQLRSVLEPLAGPANIITLEGQLWKKWRSIFNPGFSIQQIVSQVPTIVECTDKLINILDGHVASNQVFRMEEETTKITIDVIGRLVCDHDFETLTQSNEFMETMRNTLAWMPDFQSINPFHRMNPLRPYMWKHCKSSQAVTESQVNLSFLR